MTITIDEPTVEQETARDSSLQLFRAIWPIKDTTLTREQLIAEATSDLANVAARARAELYPGGRWRVLPSSRVPGSGDITKDVLVYECRARSTRRPLEKCPRCRGEFLALVADTGMCVGCDSLAEDGREEAA